MLYQGFLEMMLLRIAFILILVLNAYPMNITGGAGVKLIWTTSKTERNDPFLTYVTGNPLDIDAANFTPIHYVDSSRVHYPYSLTFDYHRSMLYYADNRAKTIYGSSVANTFNFEAVFVGLYNSLDMAVDWSTGNIYWVDGLLNWIAFKSTMDKDPLNFKVLIDQNVYRPIGITLDPVKGYLFWTNKGTLPCVKRASLSGDSPEVIVSRGVFTPRGMTVDIASQRIYWIDSQKETIEQCEYDGRGRRILRKINGNLFRGIDFYKGVIFVTDTKNKDIKLVKEGSGFFRNIPINGEGIPIGVTVYAPEEQPSLSDPCLSNRCDHFCVGGLPSATCMCQDGFQLQPDGKTCDGSSLYASKLLVIATRKKVLVSNVTGLFAPVPRFRLLFVDGSNIVAIAVDTQRRLIYVGDKAKQSIKRLHLNGTSEFVTNAGLIEGLSFDWLTNTLYWSDSEAEAIKSYDLSTDQQFTVVSSGGSFVGQVTVDPFTSQLFWISGSPASLKSKSYLNNDPVKTLVSKGMSQPKDLHCDFNKQTIIWTDALAIKSVSFNGNVTKSLVTTNEYNNYGLVNYKDIYIWSSSFSSTYYLNTGNNARNRPSTQVSVPVSSNIVAVRVMDVFMQPKSRDVCFNNGGCDQYCIPTTESRECECELGFALQPDQKSCKTERLTAEHILFIDFLSSRIYEVDPISGRLFVFASLTDESTGLAMNPGNSRVYWSEFNTRTIQSSKLDGSDVAKLIDTGTEYASRIAVDPTTGNVFYTAFHQDTNEPNNTNSYIAVVHPDGTARRVLISGLYSPRALELHSSRGIMFWSESSINPIIERANMDGSQRQAIITTDVKRPSGIAIDFEDDLLYWCDGFLNVIERCTFSGSNRQILVNDPAAHLFSLLVVADKLYYTGWNKPGIVVVNKADGGNKQFLVESPIFAELHDLILVIPNSQPTETSACSINNGGCSTFCLPTALGRTCACADRVSMKSDGVTCEGYTPVTSALVPKDTPVTSALIPKDTPVTSALIPKDILVTSALVPKDSPAVTSLAVTEGMYRPLNDAVVIAGISSATVILVAVLVVVVVIVVRKRCCKPFVVENSSAGPYDTSSLYSTINLATMDISFERKDSTYLHPTATEHNVR